MTYHDKLTELEQQEAVLWSRYLILAASSPDMALPARKAWRDAVDKVRQAKKQMQVEV